MISAKQSMTDQFIVSGSNFLVIVIAARFLEFSDVAKYAYAFSFFQLLYMFAYAWIYQNAMALGPQALASRGIVAKYSGLNIILSIIYFPVTIVAYQVFVSGDLLVGNIFESFLVAAFVMINQLIDFERRILYYCESLSSISPAIISFFGFFIRVVALLYIEPSSFIEFITILIIASIPGLFFCRSLVGAFKNNFYSFTIEQLKNGRWVSLDIPINWAWAHAPVFIVGSIIGLNYAGVYAAIRSVANISNVAMELIPTYFASKLSYLYTAGRFVEYRRFIRFSILIGIMAWTLVFLFLLKFSEYALVNILGNEFSAYSELLLLFWAYNLFLLLIRFQYLHLRFIDGTSIIPISNGIAVLILSVSSYFFIQKVEVLGVAISMILGSVSIVLIQSFGIMYFANFKRRV